MNNERLNKLQSELEPFQSDIDFLVKDVIKLKVSAGQYKYYNACIVRVTALYYLMNKIEEWDAKYKEYLNLHITQNSVQSLNLSHKKEWDENYLFYYPFYEAIEFENLLSQGKSCLDCFSQAIGSIYKESPNDIDGLINVLKNNHLNSTTKKILDLIEEKERLSGIIVDPKKNRKKA